MATLHHQIVYCLQNHALDLKNQGTRDALMVLADSGSEVPTIIQVLKQLDRKRLEQLVPVEWMTGYEKLHNETEPIKSLDFEFKKMDDGTVKIAFETEKQTNPSIPQFQLMIEPGDRPHRRSPPIYYFRPDGVGVLTDKINGHFIWDVDPVMCDSDCSCVEQGFSGSETDSDDDDDPDYDSAEDDRREMEMHRQWLEQYYREKKKNPAPKPYRPPDVFMMENYDHNFPPLERQDSNGTSSKPFVQQAVEPSGQRKPLSQGEEVFNWQSRNATAQNRALRSIDHKVSQILEEL